MKPSYTFSYDADGQRVLSINVPQMETHYVAEDHPNYKLIVEALRDEDFDKAVELIDTSAEEILAETMKSMSFVTLSDRFSYRDGKLYLDGDEAPGVLADQIVRFIQDDVGSWEPLVNFYTKLLANPNPHSRDQLYRWLATHDFTITEDGDIVGYKFVNREGDKYKSTSSGYSIVDGVEMRGYTVFELGSVVTMPRSQVTFDPKIGCSAGLHVGNWAYVGGGWGRVKLEVHVNPSDVVSVPTEARDGKMRVCRYVAVAEITEPYSVAVKGGLKLPALTPDPSRSTGVYAQTTFSRPTTDYINLFEEYEQDEEEEYCDDPNCPECALGELEESRPQIPEPDPAWFQHDEPEEVEEPGGWWKRWRGRH